MLHNNWKASLMISLLYAYPKFPTKRGDKQNKIDIIYKLFIKNRIVNRMVFGTAGFSTLVKHDLIDEQPPVTPKIGMPCWVFDLTLHLHLT